MKVILIVDDNSQNLYLLEAILKGYGYKVTSAKNGKEALDLARNNIPDLIISDILMPVMDGFELCRQWKADNQLNKVPFVFYTATYTEPKDEEFALSLGAERFVVKPQKPEILKEVIKELLEEFQKKTLVSSVKPLGEEAEFLRHHNEVIFSKLEKKMMQLEKEINNRKEIEEKLRKSEERYRTVADYTFDWEYWLAPDGKIIYISPSSECITGYTPGDFITDPELLFSIVHPDDIQKFEKHEFNREANKNQNQIYQEEFRIIKRDGELRWIDHICRPIYNSEDTYLGIRASNRDITERKQAESALYESESRLDSAMASGRISWWELEFPSGDVKFNARKAEMIGYQPEMFKHYSDFTKLLHPEDYEKAMRAMRNHLDGKTDKYEVEYRLKHKNGNYVWFKDIGRITECNENKSEIIVTGVVIDITERKLAEEMILENEEKFRNLFDNSPVGKSLTDLDGSLNVNKSFCKILGYSKEEFSTKKFQDITHPDDIQKSIDKIQLLLDGKIEQVRFEKRFIHKNGKTVWGDVSIYLQRDRKGETQYFITTISDITQRKKTEEELNKYRVHLEELVAERTQNLDKERILLRTLIDSIPDLIYIKDNECRFILVNKNVISVFGMKDVEAILGKNDFDLFSREIAEKYFADEKNILSSGESLVNSEEMINLSNGEKHWYGITKVPLKDNNDKIIGIVGINRDITKLKIFEENLQKSKEAAESANQAKTIFLSNMSHEIRTPMNVILGFSQLMLRDESITPLQKERLNNITRSGEHLLALINDILEISKIEAGHLTINYTKINLHEFFDNLESMFKVRTDAKRLVFNINSIEKLPKFIICDESKLRQIFINLIGNAVKFTDKGEISVNVGIKKIDNDIILEADVSDSGYGIAEEDMKRIFNLFEQTTAGIKAGGTGLGLALCKKLINILGGDITVKSALNKGSSFIFNIKVKESDQEEVSQIINKQRVTGLKPGQKKYKILVADDVIENRIFLRDILKLIGFDVVEAENGKDAIEKLKECPLDLIIMDIDMPVLNGFEAIEYIKKIKESKNIPIIVVTSYVLNEEKHKILELGANVCLSKPFREQEIFNALKFCLDIEYKYESVEKYDSTYITEEIKKRLSTLPKEIIKEMLDAIVSLELKRLFELIDKIGEMYPETADFLRNAAKKYQYDLLMKLFSDLRSVK